MGVGLGVGVGVGNGVAVGVGVGVGVAVGSGVAVGNGVAVGMGVAVGIGVAVDKKPSSGGNPVRFVAVANPANKINIASVAPSKAMLRRDGTVKRRVGNVGKVGVIAVMGSPSPESSSAGCGRS